jgi:flagellar hook protein FlgE
MGYGIGLAGLTTTAQAIDVVSNNIANAQTVGYKNGQFVFADMYFRANDAQAKDRVGMGSQQQAIRRDQSYGSVTSTQNPLDLAITGPGMFMLAKDLSSESVPIESPSKFEYTRNGQFGTDKDNRMINASGLYLVGYPADEAGNIIAGAKSTMTLDQKPLPSQPTQNSVVNLNMDTRKPALDIAFRSTDSTTYSQSTSQTIYDQNGTGHILAMYYKRVSSQLLELELQDDGSYKYNPTQSLDDLSTKPDNEQMNLIASTYKGESTKYSVAAGARELTDGEIINSETLQIYGAQKTYTGGSEDEAESTYDLTLSDGTHVPITQTLAGVIDGTTGLYTTKPKFTASVDRYEVYATIDGNKVGHNPDTDDDVSITLDNGYSYEQQISIGTMAFLGGRNIDTLQLGTDGNPYDGATTSFKFNALSTGGTNGYGITDNDGIMQFTLTSDEMTALTAPGQTYTNNQDGHTVSNLASYAIDSSGNLVASYDNGETFVKGQLILAQFGNLDGLMPNGSNTFTATAASGDPILSAPGSGLLGQVRSKALEASNVDLTAQLVQLMVLQRQYSATSQALKLQASTMIDDAINMGR